MGNNNVTGVGLQASLKLPGDTLLNIQAADPDEFLNKIKWMIENIHELVALSAAAQTAYGLGARTVPQGQAQQPPSQQTQQGQYQNPWGPMQGQQSQQGTPQWQQPPNVIQFPGQQGQPQQPQFSGGQQSVPTCPHGPMAWKTGTNRTTGAPYAGYYCTVRNSGCKPVRQ